MATESAADTELSVTLPPSLSEWLDERARALDIEREALLVELLETHRSAAEMDAEGIVSLLESADGEEPALRPASDGRIDALDERADDIDDRIGNVDSRVDDVEAELANNVEDVRNRVLQLRDAVEARAPADHSHEELRSVSDRFDELSAEFDDLSAELDAVSGETDDLGEEVRGLSSEIGSVTERLGTVEDKLDRLARAVVANKRRLDTGSTADTEFGDILRAAHRTDTTEAACGGCGETVRLGLLSEAACPHCERRFEGLEEPTSLLRRFRQSILTVVEDPDARPAEASDE